VVQCSFIYDTVRLGDVFGLGLARCGKSCRLRWTNYLRPDIKRGRFSHEEEQTIFQLHAILGNRYSFNSFLAKSLTSLNCNFVMHRQRKMSPRTLMYSRLLLKELNKITSFLSYNVMPVSSVLKSTASLTLMTN